MFQHVRVRGPAFRALFLVAISAAIPACKEGAPAGRVGARAAPGVAASGLEAAGDPTCQGTGAHDRHTTFATACQTCHPCGGRFGLAPGLALPSGAPVTGAITSDATGTSCNVSCHAPPGQPAPTVSWSATGPFACSACHAQGAPAPAGGSSHPADQSSPLANRAACQSCHELSAHVSGNVRILTPSGTVQVPAGGSSEVNPACEACHLGRGRTLADRSPPLLVGWSDTGPAGDWHGARAGTGSGGSLVAPYARGQGPLACTACHDAHGSGNPFLFAASANGQVVGAGLVSRAGVGAELLCTGCHAGARHAYCATCHASDPEPAGAPCLACHGHEGIRGFPWPTTPSHGITGPPPGSPGDCRHCHNPGWAPIPESIPPVLSAVQVSDVAATTAKVSWTTDEPSSSFVEYGEAAAGLVTGDAALSTSHAVTITGLSGLTSYVFRVRSADRSRNVAESGLATFQTSDPYAPSAPVLDPGPWSYTYDDFTSVRLSWSIEASPAGNPVEYRAVVDTLPSFTAPVADSGWIATPWFTATLPTLSWPDQYYWRVQARDGVVGAVSQWSSTGTFAIWYGW